MKFEPSLMQMMCMRVANRYTCLTEVGDFRLLMLLLTRGLGRFADNEAIDIDTILSFNL